MSYRYHIECYADNLKTPWVKIKEGSLQYCQGFLDARKDYAPRLHQRIVRSDGKIIGELPANHEVRIGQVAGWPTAGQYERAGNEALERARKIRERDPHAFVSPVQPQTQE